MILHITILNTFRIFSHSIIEILNISRWYRDNYYNYIIIILAVQETLEILYFSFLNLSSGAYLLIYFVISKKLLKFLKNRKIRSATQILIFKF
jgi:hypothetical protein